MLSHSILKNVFPFTDATDRHVGVNSYDGAFQLSDYLLGAISLVEKKTPLL